MQIDPHSSIPVFRQIVEGIRAEVAAGIFKTGDLIPSVRQQAGVLLVNPNTVQRAYEELERTGLIVSQRGTGMVVAPRSRAMAQNRTESSVTENFAQGIALGRSAMLSRPVIDKLYVATWVRAGEDDNAGRSKT